MFTLTLSSSLGVYFFPRTIFVSNGVNGGTVMLSKHVSMANECLRTTHRTKVSIVSEILYH